MNQFRSFPIALSFAAALTLFTASTRADTWDKKTKVSFSQAIEVPGAVLQPGTYVMKLVDLPASRHVVQFMNERENRVYAAAMAIPAYRDRVTDYTAIEFYEAPAGQPEAIRKWFYPGDNDGQEFVYPKGRGVTRLAAFTSTSVSDAPNVSPVPAPEVTSPLPAQTSAVTSPAPAPEPVEVAQATPPKQEVKPAQESESVTLAQNQPVPPPATNNGATDTALPQTASTLPEVALSGLLFLAGAAAVRKFRKR